MATGSQTRNCQTPIQDGAIGRVVGKSQFECKHDLQFTIALGHEGSPEIIDCETVSLCHEEAFQPKMGVLHLNWNGCSAAHQPKPWRLPLGAILNGPAPTRFGIRIIRISADRYTLHLIWNRTGFAWADLTREEIGLTSLKELLGTLRTDLESLLDQPVLTTH